MANSTLTATQLLGISKRIRNLAKDVPNKDQYNDFRNDLNRIADRFAVSATANLLNELGSAAKNITRVTGNINRAIEDIRRADRNLKTAAQVITATGNLAEGLLNMNSEQIGGAIDDLLGITFPKL